MDEARWYVVHTYSGYENKVADTIALSIESNGMQELIFEVRVPVETVKEIRDGVEKIKKKKLLPCYVLVRMIMTDESWYLIRNIRGVTGFVGSSTRPSPLTDEEVAKFGIEIQSKPSVTNFEIGNIVKIVRGSMEGLTGTVEEIDLEAQRVKLNVSIMGKQASAELSILDIAPIV